MNTCRLRGCRVLSLAAWLLLGATAGAAESPLSEGTATDGSLFRFVHGTLDVPVRHGQPDGGTLEIAYVRIQFGAQPSKRAHLVLAGGPGASGVDAAWSIASRGGRTARSLFGRDVVGIDQRGAGRSRPSLRLAVAYDIALDAPSDPAHWLHRVRTVSAAAAKSLRDDGIDLSAFTTAESAGDVEALRQALGIEQWVLWGQSYGSRLALEVLRRQPRHIESAVLVAPEGPGQTWKLPGTADEVLARIGHRAGQPDLLQRVRRVLDRLRQRPRMVWVRDPLDGGRVQVRIGAFDVQLLTWRALADIRTIATLPAAYTRMARGDFDGIAPLVLAMRRQLGPQSALKHAIDLSEGADPIRLARIAAEEQSAALGSAVNFPGPDLAAQWQLSMPTPASWEPVTGPHRVLLLVGDLDARTPEANAEVIAATLPQARMVRVIHAAHQFNVFGDTRVREVLASFLANRPLPAHITLDPVRFRVP